MSKKFKQLLVSEGYRHYWSKYPEGYTILEALLNWVDSVNQLTENVNDWNIYLDDFVENFDEKLRPTVSEMLNEMENDGRLAEIINEEIFSWKADKTYVDNQFNQINTQINGIDSQLAQAENYNFRKSIGNHKSERQPLITWIDDDAQLGVYTKLKPLAEEYGIPFTSAVITSFVGTSVFMTLEQIQECHRAGIEFIAHGHTNKRLGEEPDSIVRYEMRESQNWMKEHGFNHRTMAYPFGSYTNRTKEISKEFFDYVIATANQDGKDVAQFPPIDNFEIRRVTVQLGFEKVKVEIDKAAENNGWVVLTSHVDQGNWYSEEYVRQIIEYAQMKGLKFATTEEGIETFGNTLQFDGSSSLGVSRDEKVFGTAVINWTTDNVYESNTPADEFEIGVTMTRITPNFGGFPNKSAGILTTVKKAKVSDGRYTVQEFKGLTPTDKWYRQVLSDGSWSPWNKDNLIFKTDLNTISALTPQAEFKEGITMGYISGAGVQEGLPGSRVGFLTTYKFVGEGRIYQEFRDYGSPDSLFLKVYTRSHDGAGNWLQWHAPNDYVYHKPPNSVTPSTPASSFEIGITITNINLQGNAGYPSGSAGVLTTYKSAPEGDGRYTYQEYKGISPSDKWVRHVNSDGTWSGWFKYTFESV